MPQPTSSPHPQPVRRRSCPGRVGRGTWLSTCPQKPPRLCRGHAGRWRQEASHPWRAWHPRVLRPQPGPPASRPRARKEPQAPLKLPLSSDHRSCFAFPRAWPRRVVLAVRAAPTSAAGAAALMGPPRGPQPSQPARQLHWCIHFNKGGVAVVRTPGEQQGAGAPMEVFPAQWAEGHSTGHGVRGPGLK